MQKNRPHVAPSGRLAADSKGGHRTVNTRGDRGQLQTKRFTNRRRRGSGVDGGGVRALGLPSNFFRHGEYMARALRQQKRVIEITPNAAPSTTATCTRWR